MAIERFNAVEYIQRVGKYAPYLGGLLEIGGSARLKVDRQRYTVNSGEVRMTTSAFPIIEVTDNDPSHVKTLNNLFGGPIDTVRRSQRWAIKHVRAYILAEVIRPYTPSRGEFSDACVNLLNTDDLEEKVRIANELQSSMKNRFRDVSEEDYSYLLRNPLFISGVLAGRCTPTYRWEATKEPSFVISSENIRLLKVMQDQFGGHIPELKDASDEVLKAGLLPASLSLDQSESRALGGVVVDFFAKNSPRYPEFLAA
jgi:hypothetical protein